MWFAATGKFISIPMTATTSEASTPPATCWCSTYSSNARANYAAAEALAEVQHLRLHLRQLSNDTYSKERSMRHPIRLSQVISALIVVLLFLLVLQSFMFRQGATETVLLGVLAGLMAVVVMQSATWSPRAAVEYKVISGSAFEEGALLQ